MHRWACVVVGGVGSRPKMAKDSEVKGQEDGDLVSHSNGNLDSCMHVLLMKDVGWLSLCP
jgi:hypothetical protein